MTQIRALIIDDEKYARQNLLDELKAYDDFLEIIGEANSVESGVERIAELDPDLLFLDINLGDGTGFDLLEKIDRQEIKVVFITAYNQYAIKAFRFSALDYLLKPLNQQELSETLNKIKMEFQQQQRRPLLNEILRNIEGFRPKRIAIPAQDGFSLHDTSEIIRCQSDGNYTQLFFENGQKMLSSKTLKYFQDLLQEYRFERVHNSHLVNLQHIKRYLNQDGGVLQMSDGSQVPISQRKKSQVLAVLERL
ncbi:MAG: response regulator transcription factor [Bacteroidetes bacterium]|nr:MAG: response regulator transcription factor [Bacteroidota bacterium]